MILCAGKVCLNFLPQPNLNGTTKWIGATVNRKLQDEKKIHLPLVMVQNLSVYTILWFLYISFRMLGANFVHSLQHPGFSATIRKNVLWILRKFDVKSQNSVSSVVLNLWLNIFFSSSMEIDS